MNIESRSLVEQALNLTEARKFKEALELSLENYDDCRELSEVIALVYAAECKFEPAFYWCNKAIESGYESGVVFDILSKIYFYGFDSLEVDFLKSVEFSKKAYRFAERYGYKTVIDCFNTGVIYCFNIGFIYFELMEYTKAAVYFQKAMKEGHVYAELYFTACMFRIDPVPMPMYKLVCLAYRARIKRLFLSYINKDDMRLYKGILHGNKIMGDYSVISTWIDHFKK
jgi:tetratricopeptide (TPR) repeat protein